MNYIKSIILLIVCMSSNFIDASAGVGGADQAAVTGKKVKVWFGRFNQTHPSKDLVLRCADNLSGNLRFSEREVNAGQISLAALKALAAQDWQVTKEFQLMRVNDIVRRTGSGETYISYQCSIDLANGCITSDTVQLDKDYLKFLLVSKDEGGILKPQASAAAASATAIATATSKK